MKINKAYFDRISDMSVKLQEAHIPHRVNIALDGGQLRFPWCDGDVVCHYGSYGAKRGYVESYEFPWDEGDVSMLMPDEMVKKIIEYYKQTLDN